MAAQTAAGAPNADEGDETSEDEVPLGSKSYSSARQREREELCINCDATYKRSGSYHGYYCPTCRQPDGFIDE